MAVSLVEMRQEDNSDRNPFLMEHSVGYSGHEHGYVINITGGDSSATSVFTGFNYIGSNVVYREDRPSTSIQVPASRSPSSPTTVSGFRNASLTRRQDDHGRRHRNPLNSGLWISIELIANVSQILAAFIVISFSRNEHPRAPLFAWVIGYSLGCAARLPHLYWRYRNHNRQGFDQASSQALQPSFHNIFSESTPSTVVPFTQRLNALVDRFKMALDCFFAIWFVVGNVWIFGGRSTAADAPNLYRLCVAFLAFSCIGYAMPFILCAIICCCFPCIISILGFREDLTHTRGATLESIKALPTYKFISKRNLNQELNQINSETYDGGILGIGTDKERIISSEDAVCSICLAEYVENDDLRELPCQHFFHTKCVDKWLKINALCPLCKYAIGDAAGISSILSSIRLNNNQMVGDGGDDEQNAF